MRIGVIGLGAIGGVTAVRLLEAGLEQGKRRIVHRNLPELS